MPALTKRQKRLAHFSKIPRLSAARAKLSATALDGAMKNLAKRLKRAGESGCLQVQVATGRRTTDWTFEMSENSVVLAKKKVDKPNLRVCLSEDDAWAIASGSVSPAEVYLNGKMLIVGECAMAKRLYARLGSRGSTEIE